MSRKIGILVCTVAIATSVFFVGVAHSQDATDSIAVSSTPIHPSVGEILLEGRVLRVAPDGGSLTLQAERFTLPSGRSGSVTPLKEKIVTFSPQSVRGSGNAAAQLENARVQVVGPDGGAGTPLAAREILVLAMTAATPPNAETDSPFPPAERLALGKKLLSEAALLLEAPHGQNYDYAYRQHRIEIAKGYIFLRDFASTSMLVKSERSPGWDAQAWAEIGKFQAEIGDKTAAKQSLREALSAIQASSVSALNKPYGQRAIIELAAQLGDATAAQTQYQQMNKNGGQNGYESFLKDDIIPLLCSALAAAGRLDEANKRILETSLLSLRVQAYAEMSQTLRRQGRINEAIQSAEKGWQVASKILSPTEKCDSWWRIGEAFGMVGYRKRARLAFALSVSDLANVQEGLSWVSVDQNGKETSGVTTYFKPRFATATLEAQARTGDVDEAVKLLPRITAPDEYSLKTYVYANQVRACFALARSYAAQERLEEAASSLIHARDSINKMMNYESYVLKLELKLLEGQIALKSSQSVEATAFVPDVQKILQEMKGEGEEGIRNKADAALLLLQSTQPQSLQDKPLPPRVDEPNYAPSAIPSSKPIPNVRFVPSQETLLTCLAIPAVSYRIYWPKTKATGQLKNAMLMIPAGGSAPILSKKLADEFGWAMISLQKTTYNQGELAGAANAAIKDFEMRLKRPLIWRFAGFSAGGYAAAAVAQTHDDHCAGLFMMGSSWYFSGHTPKYPVVFLVGTQDFNRASGERDFAQVQKLGVPSLLISPNAGHTMGSVLEQETSIRFLATHYAPL